MLVVKVSLFVFVLIICWFVLYVYYKVDNFIVDFIGGILYVGSFFLMY